MSTTNDSVAVGIDLGTTHCCVAYINKNNAVDIIANRGGDRTTPSYVVLTEEGILVGKIAKEEYFTPPGNVVYDSKRLIGRNFDDKYIQDDIKNWTFKVKNSQNKPIIELSLENGPVCYKPQEISAMLLDHMKKVAEEYIGKPVTDAIITVPAHFNYHQRTATAEAGKLAGLNVLGTINEPTAAALSYIHKNNITEPRVILVFDLGGGTFDVSIVKVNSNNITVVATAGNTHLGGRDFDNNLIKLISKKITEQFGEDALNSPLTKRRIRAAGENIKVRLSSVRVAVFDMQAFHNGEDVQIKISREEFEEINSELFLSTLDIVQNCLTDAELNKAEIDDVVLVGGSVRVPKIQQLLSEFFDGKTLSKAVNFDEAIAYGAAVQIAKFNNSNKMEAATNVTDITPLSLGISTQGDIMNVFIPRNSTIPATARNTYVSVHDKQTTRSWYIYEGERRLTTENILLGKCTLKTEPNPPGCPVDLMFEIDENGILQVSAREVSGKHTKLSIAYQEHDPQNVNDIIQDAELHETSDKEIERVTENLNHLGNYCVKLKAICDYDKYSMSSEDKDAIKTIAEEIDCWTIENKVTHGNEEEDSAITEKLKQVDEVCEPLAEKYGFDVKNVDWEEFYELITKQN